MAKYVFKEDLPEVIRERDSVRGIEMLKVEGHTAAHFFTAMEPWTAERHRREGMARLAIAEYLDNLKPQLPTEPGSVILAYKAQGWVVNPRGTHLSLTSTGEWSSLDGTMAGIRSVLIEEWKPVQLNVVEVAS